MVRGILVGGVRSQMWPFHGDTVREIAPGRSHTATSAIRIFFETLEMALASASATARATRPSLRRSVVVRAAADRTLWRARGPQETHS